MTLRCKPGDLAFIIASTTCPQDIGMLVEVIYMAESDFFQMPDGYWYRNCKGGWVIRSLGRAFTPGPGLHKKSWFDCYSDEHLKPLPKDAEPESIVRELETT